MAKSRYDVWCSTCGCLMKKRSGKFGDFYGCTGYPKCTETLSIRDGVLQAVHEEEEEEFNGIREDEV